MKMKKLEKKISKLEEQKLKKPSSRLDKKIIKLEKKKVKLEKWLKIKLPLRILIKGAATWLIIGGVCYGCSYIPIVKEIKMATMGAVAYVAPDPVVKVLDVVTLNIGANKNDFEWLKTTLQSYLDDESKLEVDNNTGFVYDDYRINGQQVTEEEYNQYISKNNEKLDNMAEEVLGATSLEQMSSMSIPEILIKVATNSTPEIVSQFLDMSNLTKESKQRVEQDVNRAIKIIPKLNNNQMDELVNMINSKNEENQKQDKLQAEFQMLCSEFIESVRTTGKVTSSNYDKIQEKIKSTNDTFNVETEIKVLEETNQSINGEIPYSSTKLNIADTHTLREGDIISITITNSANQIIASYSGMVIVNGK